MVLRMSFAGMFGHEVVRVVTRWQILADPKMSNKIANMSGFSEAASRARHNPSARCIHNKIRRPLGVWDAIKESEYEIDTDRI